MRLFTSKENTIIKQLVAYKQSGKLRDLQVAPLLRKNLSILALRWEVEPIPQVFVYAPHRENRTIEESTRENFFSVLDFVFFIEELVERRFVKLLEIPSRLPEKQRILYDKEKYSFNSDKNQFVENGVDESFLSLFGDFQYQLFGVKGNMTYATNVDAQIIPNSFAYNLDKIAYTIIYPLPIAEEYVREGFYSLEDRRHISQQKLNSATLLTTNESLRTSKDALKISNRSYKVAICALLLSFIFGLIQCCSDSKVEDNQFDKLIQTIQDNARTTIND